MMIVNGIDCSKAPRNSEERYQQVVAMSEAMRRINPAAYDAVAETVRKRVAAAAQAGAFTNDTDSLTWKVIDENGKRWYAGGSRKLSMQMASALRRKGIRCALVSA